MVAAVWTYMSSRGTAPVLAPAAPLPPIAQLPPPAGPTYVFNLTPNSPETAPMSAPAEVRPATPAPDLSTSTDPPLDKDVGPPAEATPRKININTATIEELDLLPGVGRSTAQKIVDYRAKHGKFRTISELDRVSGIGPAKLEHLRPLVTVD